jgi:hypothetical protein
MLPPGLEIDPGTGVISGTPTACGTSRFTALVTDGASGEATSEFELAIDPDQEASRLVLPQVACGAGWKTYLHLVNPSPSVVEVTVVFWNDDGCSLELPVRTSVPGCTGERLVHKVVSTLQPGSGLDIETADRDGLERAGWVEVECAGAVTGYAQFESSSSGRAAAEFVPVCEPSFLLPYDNTDGRQVGMALVNPDGFTPATVVATIWDSDWVELRVEDLELLVKGHQSFMLAAQFPVTAGKRGVIEFRAAPESEISGLGLQFDADGRFFASPRLVAPAQRRP